jgi:uncharacterized protein (TIGR03437 family)
MIAAAGMLMLAGTAAWAQAAPSGASWQLIWSDEFNGPAGSLPNPAYWTYDLGTDCCGNNELETYTNSPENVHLDGLGHLDIHIESPEPGVYTSARIKTEGLFGVEYGRIESRIKIPYGPGMWPAFWMLGNNITAIGWPACGEIDIMENIGSTPATAYGSLHGPGNFNQTSQYQLASGALADDYHVYAVEWSASEIDFYVDGNLYETQSSGAAGWVFNVPSNPFFIILNAAVGGDWPGPPNATTQFPQDMLVDYVRVYQAVTTPGPIINTGGVADSATFGSALAPGSLASIFGQGLATGVNAGTFDFTTNSFPESASGVQVFVNGAAAPLLYLSPTQINFAVPWDSLVGTPINVEVLLNGVLSNAVPTTLTSTAPSAFGEVIETPGPYYSLNMAFIECLGLNVTQPYPLPGEYCTIWGNGFGPTNPSQTDGVPAVASPLPKTANTCSLTIGGSPATVTYCGAAPGEVIYQMDFVYPSGVQMAMCAVKSTITINGNSGDIWMWPPSACAGP